MPACVRRLRHATTLPEASSVFAQCSDENFQSPLTQWAAPAPAHFGSRADPGDDLNIGGTAGPARRCRPYPAVQGAVAGLAALFGPAAF